MPTSLNIVLFRSHTLKDGTHPVKLRIIHNRVTRYIGTDISLKPDQWDERKHCVINHLNKVKMNHYLEKRLVGAKDKLLEVTINNQDSTLDDIMREISSTSEQQMLIQFVDRCIDQLNRSNRFGTATVYTQVKRTLLIFTGNPNLKFSSITPSFLHKLEAWHLEKGNSLGGLSVYMRTLRAIFNRAISEKIIKKALYPFDDYTIRSPKTRKRAIRKEYFERIRKLDLEPGHRLFTSWREWLFLFYCRGMNWKDMCMLEWDKNIVDGRIEYTRAKGGQLISIKINSLIQEILDQFNREDEKSLYIFPVITKTDKRKIYLQIKDKIKRFNKDLHEIGEMCQLPIKLTSYVSRHSWATIAKELNIPIPVISEGLGHRDIKTTQIYLDGFDYSVLDEANDLISE